jgi:ABC-type Fe3+/spermidine/putrescine transport system ATPase subunit
MLQVKNISFKYHEDKPVLENISFSVAPGKHTSIMGESGCGKSTLLKLIYGLLDADQGTLFWNETPILGPKYNLVPGFESFKYLAQDFDLMPFTSVAENIAKFLSRFHPKDSKKRTEELLKVIEMEAFANTKVRYLSGGQQQRVAIARALAKEPALLLLDEPFSQVDNFRKNALRRSLFTYLKEQNIACIVATHDKNDALSFADQLIVLRDKKILVNSSPLETYKNPKENYIASLFDDVNELQINDTAVLLYPHQIKIVKESGVEATVIKAYFKGSYWLIEAEFKHQRVLFNHHANLEIDTKVRLVFGL